MKSDLNTKVNMDASENPLISYSNTMQFTGLEFKVHFQTSQFILFTYICCFYYLEEIKEE